ncbi:MAG: PIN domain-containing protein [Thermoanaerobaculia bacterium]
MFKILIDTCVWLDLAKDSQQRPLLSALEELVRDGRVSLIVPSVVRNEFDRNRARVAEDSGRSLTGVLRRVRDVIERLGDARGKTIALKQLQDVGHRIPLLGEAAIESIAQIDALLAGGENIEMTDAMKLRGANRAILAKAPFHHRKNSMADAIIMETYASIVSTKDAPGTRYIFVTHNIKDFSHPSGSDALPHPDFADCFSRVRSRYFIRLAEALHRIEPALVSEKMFEAEATEAPRRLSEILVTIEELLDKVWYNRHLNTRYRIERGKTKLVDKETFPVRDHATRPIQKDVWEGALRAAARVEKKYGLENLGPWSDFEWGMLNGKLSALRWALGDEWDNLDT